MTFFTVLKFFTTWDYVIMPLLLALVAVFFAVNALVNPYRKQNKRFVKCTRNTISHPTHLDQNVACLPDNYLRQWRAYVNSGATKPSLTMEFVPQRAKFYLTRCLALATATCIAYVVAFILDTSTPYAVFCLCYALLCALCFVCLRFIHKGNDKRARKIFGNFVAEANKYANFGRSAPIAPVAQTVNKLDGLRQCDTTKNVLQKASDLLKNGLRDDRSADDQRKINLALNALLQSYARNAKNNA